MRRDDAIRLLREHAEQLRHAGIMHISLFGSVARDAAGAESDVDVVVETAPGRPMTLFTIGPLHDLLVAILNCPVDIIDRTGFERAPRFRRRVGELLDVF